MAGLPGLIRVRHPSTDWSHWTAVKNSYDTFFFPKFVPLDLWDSQQTSVVRREGQGGERD